MDNLEKKEIITKNNIPAGERGFYSGHPKFGGRQKGTKNKNRLSVQDKLENMGVDVVNDLINIANTTESEELRVNILKDLLKYIAPQRKAVEVEADLNICPVINIEGL